MPTTIRLQCMQCLQRYASLTIYATRSTQPADKSPENDGSANTSANTSPAAPTSRHTHGNEHRHETPTKARRSPRSHHAAERAFTDEQATAVERRSVSLSPLQFSHLPARGLADPSPRCGRWSKSTRPTFIGVDMVRCSEAVRVAALATKKKRRRRSAAASVVPTAPVRAVRPRAS